VDSFIPKGNDLLDMMGLIFIQYLQLMLQFRNNLFCRQRSSFIVVNYGYSILQK